MLPRPNLRLDPPGTANWSPIMGMCAFAADQRGAFGSLQLLRFSLPDPSHEHSGVRES